MQGVHPNTLCSVVDKSMGLQWVAANGTHQYDPLQTLEYE